MPTTYRPDESNYRVAVGWDNNDTSLVRFNPQPRSLGVRYTRRNYMGDGQIIDEGGYIELLWSALADSAMYRAVLTQLGLNNTNQQKVTISVRDEVWTYHRYNGMAHRPQIGSEADWQYMPQNITVLIRDLVLLS